MIGGGQIDERSEDTPGLMPIDQTPVSGVLLAKEWMGVK